MKNYWRMSDFSILSVPYAYVDHSSYLADQLFVQNKVTMKFKREMVRDDSPYCIVFCKVLKKDVERFEEALGRLKDKMLLLGYKDYSNVCSEIGKMIDEGTKARKRKLSNIYPSIRGAKKRRRNIMPSSAELGEN